MGWINLAISLGSAALKAGAATSAAATQAGAVDRATAETKAAGEQAREDVRLFKESGERQLPGIESLIGDPEAQKKFVTENPFFTALADEAQRRIFQNQAAKGKVGSGGTAEALQNSILLLGEGLIGRNVAQRQRLVDTGAQAAGRSAEIARGTGRDIAELSLQRGNVEAAGTVGATEAITGGARDIVDLLGQEAPAAQPKKGPTRLQK